MMKIMLDAGHGKNTPGKRTPDGMREWEFNAKTAQYVKDYLGDYQGIETKFAHDTTGKVDIPLTSRTNAANAWKADVYVSIHANAAGSGWSSAHGIETFTYTTKPKEAVALAKKVQNAIVKATGLTNRGVKAADLHVVRETHMTAILIECGFMTNKAEAALLKSDAYRKKVARAVVDGLADQYNLKKKNKPKPAPKKDEPKKDSKSIHKVQVGAFADEQNAEKLAAELKKKGYPVHIVEE
ncbi:MAG: N-acetylmuramoyl-L-alanine amidase [Bacillus sp. (in: firmicutes)]